jgi:hypothetical protein
MAGYPGYFPGCCKIGSRRCDYMTIDPEKVCGIERICVFFRDPQIPVPDLKITEKKLKNPGVNLSRFFS